VILTGAYLFAPANTSGNVGGGDAQAHIFNIDGNPIVGFELIMRFQFSYAIFPDNLPVGPTTQNLSFQVGAFNRAAQDGNNPAKAMRGFANNESASHFYV